MAENGRMRILAFGGSLRKGSYNKAVLKAALSLAPAGVEMEEFDIKDIPVFNQDLDIDPPGSVAEFKKKIKEADAVLVVTPEYNFSIPGFIKNAIDWASRPDGDNSFDDKPVAIMSASNGSVGGSRAQYHLRQVFVYLNAHVLNKPEVLIPHVTEKVDSAGNLTDEKTREKISAQLAALVEWAERLRK